MTIEHYLPVKVWKFQNNDLYIFMTRWIAHTHSMFYLQTTGGLGFQTETERGAESIGTIESQGCWERTFK